MLRRAHNRSAQHGRQQQVRRRDDQEDEDKHCRVEQPTMRATSLATSVISLALLAVALAEVVGAPVEGLAVSEPRNLLGQLQLQEARQQRQRLLESKKERRQARKREKRRRRRERRRRRREERQRRKEAQQDEDSSPEEELTDDEAEGSYDDSEDGGSGGGGDDYREEGDGEDGDDTGSGGGDGDENSNRDPGDEDGGDDNGSGGGGGDDDREADDGEDGGDDYGGRESGGGGADASVSDGGESDEDSNRDDAGDESSNRDGGDDDDDGSQETVADDDDDASASSEPRSETSAECGSLSDWVPEGGVSVSGSRYTFTPGGSGRAEVKRVIGRSDATVFDESLTYSGSLTGMEAGTGVIVFQYHGDGSGTVVKVYYDNRGDGRHENYENGEPDTPYEDGSGEPLFDLYVRCNDGNRESGRNLLRAGLRDGDDFTFSMSKDTSGVFDISISGGGSHTCDISGWNGGIYPKFGAYPQGGGSYGDVTAVFNVESFNCS